MNSATRVLTALRHTEPDRVPLDIGGTRLTGVHINAYRKYRREMGLPETNSPVFLRFLQLATVEEDFRLRLGVDIESVNPSLESEEPPTERGSDGQRFTDRYGCKWFMPNSAEYFDVQQPPLADATSTDDIDRYPWPVNDSPVILANFQTDAATIWHEHQRAIYVGRTCPGIFEMLSFLCGHEKALTDLALNPSFSEHLMDKILDLKLTYYRAAVELLIAAGVEYFVVAETDDLATQNGPLIGPQMYRRMVKPRHKKLFDTVKQFAGGRAFISLHSCGAVREFIPDFIEIGVQILNPVQVSAFGMDDTKALKRDFGDALTFHGGAIDTQNTLAKGTPEQIRDEVRRRIDDLAPGGAFIFTPVHNIQPDVPYVNFEAMIQAYRECCQY